MLPVSVFASYDCDGTDDNLLSSGSTPVTGYPFTMGGWVKLTATGSLDRMAGLVDEGNNNNHWMFESDSSDNFDGQTRISSTNTTGNNVGALDTTNWRYVAVIATSTTSVTWYYEGSGTSSATNPGGTPATIDSIKFCEDGSGLNDASVSIGYWAIWTSALSTANIDSLAGGANPCTFSPAPAACWPMTADATDSVGSYDLTVTGATLDSGDNPTITSGIAPIAQQRQQMQ